ncbi:MAG: hypothetical protein AAF573_22705 [Bacteroidota bacterium]
MLYIFVIILLAGCKTTYPRMTPSAPNQEIASFNDPNIISESLFTDKAATISEEDIQRLLNGKIEIPDTINIAILNMNSTQYSYRRYYWGNEEEMQTQRDYFELLKSKLESTGRTKKIFLLPKLMINTSPTLTQLRESAVRMQADMLLIFNIQSDLYYKYKMFKKNEVKAFATCESLLMDIRTGVIPFSDVLTHDVLLKKDEEDFNNEELKKRATRKAAKMTLESLGSDLVDFFKNEI